MSIRVLERLYKHVTEIWAWGIFSATLRQSPPPPLTTKSLTLPDKPGGEGSVDTNGFEG